MASKIKRDQTVRAIYWLLSAITIAGLAFLFLPKKDPPVKLRAALSFSDESRAVIDDYLQWDEVASDENIDKTHDFNAEGLHKMADALSVLSEAVSRTAGKDSGAGITTINRIANTIVTDQGRSQHPAMMIEAFKAADDILVMVQTRVFPELEAETDRLKNDISAVHSDEELLHQKKELLAVYHRIALIIKAMSAG